MKKVLLSAYACSPIRGSEPGNGWSWALNLALQGYEVWCLTNVEDKEATEKELERLAIPNLHIVCVELAFNLDKMLLNTSSKTIYLHYYLWRKKAARVAMQMHKEKRFDVAHHVTFGSFQQGTFLWKLKDTRIIFGPVGGGQEALPAFKEYFGPAWKIERIRSLISNLSIRFSANLKNTVSRSDHILVTNQDTADIVQRLRRAPRNNIHLVLDNAIPLSMQNLQYIERKPGKTLNLLWVGRMLPRKGLNLILHALSLVPKEVDYTFTIVGGGELYPHLQGWIDQYGLDPKRLRILGQIPFNEVVHHYEQADVFIFCSLRDSCPAQLNEAMAFGLPVITLDIHGSALAVSNECGIKIKPTTKEKTAQDIARAVTTMYKDPELRKQYSRNAYNYAKGNTWERKVNLITSQFYN
ncbi:glycosyltransferase family 4 protein [Longitalea luteola]|uniref:glycosyltransferase family 4 protein n=1 Tax=Longitalea luteola TaxID=2812563 RepID=UPI001A978A38|nr:glycosyltransferase family 4 protein [Longitalea luteola]